MEPGSVLLQLGEALSHLQDPDLPICLHLHVQVFLQFFFNKTSSFLLQYQPDQQVLFSQTHLIIFLACLRGATKKFPWPNLGFCERCNKGTIFPHHFTFLAYVRRTHTYINPSMMEYFPHFFCELSFIISYLIIKRLSCLSSTSPPFLCLCPSSAADCHCFKVSILVNLIKISSEFSIMNPSIQYISIKSI